MLANIKHAKRVSSTLRYHEQKERQRQAECLTAVNFAKDLEHLTREDKLYHFNRLSTLHESLKMNVLHVSLNFHPTDKLSNDQMVKIAERYMQRIRFGDQPYLVYRHHDRKHAHMHIVSTIVRLDGTPIEVNKRDCHHSSQLTRELEKEYHLTPLGEWRKQQQTARQAQKIKHGEMSTMPAISAVLDKIVPLYKCTSMDELNAILRIYNVQACQGKEGSRLHHHRGLTYRVLDDAGNPIATPIRASLFDTKPTLPNLEKRFTQNQAETQRQQHRQRVTTLLEWNMTKAGMDLSGLVKALERQRISIVKMKDNVFYVDHETKAVFDGRQLGERYDALALRQRLTPVQEQTQALKHHQRHHHTIMHDL